jgi:hypothetical protein
MGKILCLFLMLAFLVAGSVNSQDGCPTPSYTIPANAPNILSEQQENDFGDAFAEQVQHEYLVIEDEITDNIRRIGQRLLDQAPPSKLHFQFYLVEYPEVNALSLPGGRVYISRKLVAACQNEDELAGVIAHEIGYLITGHQAIDLSSMLQKILGISSLGDRKDVLHKFDQMMDEMTRNPKTLKEISSNQHNQEDEQNTADRLFVYLLKKAGYSTDSYINLWNRVQEEGDKTGSISTNLFSFIKPGQKHLQEIQHIAEQLPTACTGPKPSMTTEQFNKWKYSVMEYSGIGHSESLPPLEWRRLLQPRLKGNISHLRYSSNGKFLLAQDMSSIYVLSREPFKVLFRIDIQNAHAAQFSPDSESIIFTTNSLHVEQWNIAEHRRIATHEITEKHNCHTIKLSPDALHLACLEGNHKLTMFNVSDGTHVFQRDLSSASSELILNMTELTTQFFSQLQFSPDGRYFIGAHYYGRTHVAYDFTKKQYVNLPQNIIDRLARPFGFMYDNRFVGATGNSGEKGAVISFPSGKVLHTMQIGTSKIDTVTHGDFIIMRPIQKYPAGIMELTQNKIAIGSEKESIDFYDNEYAYERSDGELFIIQLDKNEVLGKVELPENPLSFPTAASLSDDLNWLALSERSRGAIWDLRTGSQTFLAKTFQSAKFAPDNTLIVDFTGAGEEKRRIARINPAESKVVSSTQIEESPFITQEGLYIVEYKVPEGKKDQFPTLLSVTNALTGQELWNRDCSKGSPRMSFNMDEDKAVFVWGAYSNNVIEVSKNDPVLKKKIESKKEREGDFYIQILQASTGNVLHSLYVETGRGSYGPLHAELAGDHLVLFNKYDNQNRLLIYSISSGERLGQIFGVNGSLSPTTPLLAAENKPGVLTIYSLPSMEERGKLKFARPIVFVKFSRDGKRLFALTNDQMTYLFNTEVIVSGK